MKRIRTILPAAALLIATIGCAGDNKSSESVEPRPVPLLTIEQAIIPSQYQAVGTLRSINIATLAPKVMGNITSVHVSEGDQVRRGQTLIEIDSRDVDAQYAKARAGLDEMDRALSAAAAGQEAAQANLSLAESTYKRYQVLKERNSVSPQEFDEIETRYKAAAAGVRQAGATLEQLKAKRRQVEADIASAAAYQSYARITSPFDGVVAVRNADVGNQVAPGMPLMTIEERSKYRVESFVPEAEVGRLHVGDRAVVHIDSLGQTVDGRIAHVAPNVDGATRTYLVKTDVSAPEGVQLRSGLFASVAFELGTTKGITVPTSALQRNGELDSIFVVDPNGVARMRLVRTGRVLEGNTEILSGLQAGERIIAAPDRSVRDGLKVTDGEKRS